MPTLQALSAEYSAQWRRMAVLPGRAAVVDRIARRLLAHKPRYAAVGARAGVPWLVVAVLHERESGADFSTHLHNGDPLTARTRHVPAGRPRTGAPPFTWEESAVDALAMRGFAPRPAPGNGRAGDDAGERWPIERIAYECEGYNGWGYRSHGTPSAYLWSFSNIYRGGKYVADGVWSDGAVDQQCGVMPLVARLAELDPSIELDGRPRAAASPAPAALPVSPAPAVPPVPAAPRPPAVPQPGAARRRGCLALAAAAVVSAAQLLAGHRALAAGAAALGALAAFLLLRSRSSKRKGDD
ncbi:MAG TPA: hypothetical protein VGF60_04575 [Xanthobacteraceae bacterium]|jgi:lysozyme family protein